MYSRESNSSQNTTGVVPPSTLSRTWWKAPMSSPGSEYCERLNSSMGTASPSTVLAICLTPNDLPEPGAPKTAIDKGLEGRCVLS